MTFNNLEFYYFCGFFFITIVFRRAFMIFLASFTIFRAICTYFHSVFANNNYSIFHYFFCASFTLLRTNPFVQSEINPFFCLTVRHSHCLELTDQPFTNVYFNILYFSVILTQHFFPTFFCVRKDFFYVRKTYSLLYKCVGKLKRSINRRKNCLFHRKNICLLEYAPKKNPKLFFFLLFC